LVKKRTVIRNKTGLHARPASEFIKEAEKYTSKITIKRLDEEDAVNAKSIVMLLSLGLGKDTEVEISAKGDDEQQAVDNLVALIDSGFGE
jgi:phosphocarrier protein